jgi:hypothetical protein
MASRFYLFLEDFCLPYSITILQTSCDYLISIILHNRDEQTDTILLFTELITLNKYISSYLHDKSRRKVAKQTLLLSNDLQLLGVETEA